MNIRIHHIGYLVKNLDRAAENFIRLGYATEKAAFHDEIRDADLSFLVKDGYRIELVCPSPSSDLKPLLKKFGSAPYHICYETEDLDAAAGELMDSGYTLFKEKQSAPAISDSAEVIFLYNSSCGIIELLHI